MPMSGTKTGGHLMLLVCTSGQQMIFCRLRGRGEEANSGLIHGQLMVQWAANG